jgi:CPA1 family monovalent cation:H+ antiporter
VSVTISLLTSYAAFVPANAIGASGILATVTAGIYMGIRAPRVLPSRETRAGLVATKAALAEIDALAGEDWTREETVQRMRNMYEFRKRRLAARAGKIEDDGYEDQSLAYQQMVQLVLQAQREALLRLRSEGRLSNEVMNRIVHELDLEESRLEI